MPHMSRNSYDTRRVGRSRGMRITAVATVLALAGTAAEVPLGNVTPVAHAQYAPRPQEGIHHGEVRFENRRDWRGAIFFSGPMRVNTVALEFVPQETTPEIKWAKRVESAPLGDPVFDKFPETVDLKVEHRVWNPDRRREEPVDIYDVTVHRSIAVTPSGNYAIRLRYNLPDVQVDENHRLILYARGKTSYPTPMAGGGSRYTMPFVNLSASGKVQVHNPDEDPVARPKVFVNSKSLRGKDLRGEEAVAADGTYWLSSNMPDGTYQIEVQPPQGFVRPANKPWKGEDNAPNFDLYPITLSGKVQDDAGAGIAGARVTVGGRSAQTDKDGNFTVTKVPEGTHKLVVGETEHNERLEVAGVVVKNQRENKLDKPIVVERKQQFGKISGRVDGLPDGATATVRLAGTNTTTTTAEDGSYNFPKVEVGDYNVEVVQDSLPKGHTVSAGQSVTVDRAATVSANFTVTRDKGSISGVVSGVPADAQIKVRVSGLETKEVTVAGGSYTVDDLPTGDYTVEVIDGSMPKGYSVTGAVDATVDKGKSATADFKITADNVTGVVNVVDDANEPVAGATVTVGDRTATTNSSGVATFDGLAPGSYTARVSAVTGKYNGASQRFALYPGENGETTLQVGSLNQVSGTVVDDLGEVVAGAEVVIKQGTNEIRTVKTTEDGNFNAGTLPAGTYSAQVRATDQHGGDNKSFTIKAGEGTDAVVLEVALKRGSFEATATGPVDPAAVFLTGGPEEDVVSVEKSGDKYVLADLYPGKYTLSAHSPEGYTIDGVGTVTIEPNKTASATLNAVRNLGNIAGSVTGLPAGESAEILVRGADKNTAGVKKTAAVVNGKYTITDLPTGHYNVEVDGPTGYSAPAEGAKVVKDDTETRDFELALDDVDVELRVIDDAGLPVLNVDIEIAGQTVSTGEAGSVVVENLAPGTYTATVREAATHSDGSQEITLQPGKHGEEAEIPVKSRNAVIGKVIEDFANPVPNADIRIMQGDNVVATARSNAKGMFNAGKLFAGEYTLEVDGSTTHGKASQRFIVTPRKASTPLAQVALTKGSLSFDVTGDVDPASITVTGGPEEKTFKVEKVDGKFAVDSIYPGKYTIAAEAPSGYSVEVEHNSKVEIKPGEASSLALTVKKKPEPTTSKPTPTPTTSKPAPKPTPKPTTTTPEPEPFVWKPVVVRAGEVALEAPTQKGNSNPAKTGFATKTVQKVTANGKTEPVELDDSWIRVESDGTVVATPPRDTAPGKYRVEIATPNGKREVVDVVVAEEKPMSERFKVEWAKTPLPAGTQRNSSSPRANVEDRGFTFKDQVLPAGTKFKVDHPGASIDANGSITYKVSSDAKRGTHTIPVTITFPDESTATVNAVFEVGDPMYADLTDLDYEDEVVVVPGLSATVLRTGDAPVPEGTTFKLKSGSRLGGWTVTVNPRTGDVRVTAPTVAVRPLEANVIAYFPDGSTKEIKAHARLATTSALAVKHSVSYRPTTSRAGTTVNVKAVGDAVKGARFDVVDSAGLTVGVNANTGELRIAIPQNVDLDETYKPAIRVRYPDGSAREVVAAVTVVSDAAATNLGFVGANVPVGDQATLKPTANLPEGTRFSIDDFNEPGWKANIDPVTGEITAISSNTVPEGDTATVKVRVKYPDGSSEVVNVPLAATAPKEAPVTQEAGSSLDASWIVVIVGVIALLAGTGFAAFLNQDKIMQALGR